MAGHIDGIRNPRTARAKRTEATPLRYQTRAGRPTQPARRPGHDSADRLETRTRDRIGIDPGVLTVYAKNLSKLPQDSPLLRSEIAYYEDMLEGSDASPRAKHAARQRLEILRKEESRREAATAFHGGDEVRKQQAAEVQTWSKVKLEGQLLTQEKLVANDPSNKEKTAWLTFLKAERTARRDDASTKAPQVHARAGFKAKIHSLSQYPDVNSLESRQKDIRERLNAPPESPRYVADPIRRERLEANQDAIQKEIAYRKQYQGKPALDAFQREAMGLDRAALKAKIETKKAELQSVRGSGAEGRIQAELTVLQAERTHRKAFDRTDAAKPDKDFTRRLQRMPTTQAVGSEVERLNRELEDATSGPFRSDARTAKIKANLSVATKENELRLRLDRLNPGARSQALELRTRYTDLREQLIATKNKGKQAELWRELNAIQAKLKPLDMDLPPLPKLAKPSVPSTVQNRPGTQTRLGPDFLDTEVAVGQGGGGG